MHLGGRCAGLCHPSTHLDRHQLSPRTHPQTHIVEFSKCNRASIEPFLAAPRKALFAAVALRQELVEARRTTIGVLEDAIQMPNVGRYSTNCCSSSYCESCERGFYTLFISSPEASQQIEKLGCWGRQPSWVCI